MTGHWGRSCRPLSCRLAACRLQAQCWLAGMERRLTVESLIFVLFLMVAGGAAMLRGGQYERLAAVAIVVATVVSPLARSQRYAGPDLGIVLVDLALFIILTMISMRSSAFWPMWAAGFQLCGLAGHLAASKSQSTVPAAYADTLAIWAYAVVTALLAGTLLERRRDNGRG